MPHPQRHCGAFRLCYHLCVAWVGRIPEDGHAGEPGNDLLQKLQLFSAYLRGKSGQPSNVSSSRARLATNPLATGSTSCAKTIGIVTVASLAARVTVGPVEK